MKKIILLFVFTLLVSYSKNKELYKITDYFVKELQTNVEH